MKFCILVPHLHQGLNSEWLLYQLLNSIGDWEPGLLPHTLILDDASPVKDPELYQTLHDLYGCQVVSKDKSEGYSSVINMGLDLAKRCGYDVAVTLNNDIELKTPFVDMAKSLFTLDSKISVIGARLYYPEGRLQHQGFTVETPEYINMHEAGTFEVTRRASYMFGVTGAFQVIRLTDMRYDEEYPMAFEDVEFCARQWMCGYRVFYEPDIVAIHRESATRGKFLGEREFRSLLVHKRKAATWPMGEIHSMVAVANSSQTPKIEPSAITEQDTSPSTD